MADLTLYAPAKINLGLHVLRRREDGYHDIETVFVAIGWTDRLTLRLENEDADGGAEPATVTMSCSDRALPADESNLCIRAANALRAALEVAAGGSKATEALPPVHIHLEKYIPYGAGLGGGSSNAAAVLRGLTELWSLDADTINLPAIAAGLGADVPFFLNPVPSYATGIGEQLTPLSGRVAPAGKQPLVDPFHWTVIVVVPQIHVSTADAYRLVQPRDADRPDLAAAVTEYPPAAWRGLVENDFEPAISRKYAKIKAIRERLEKDGAHYSAMSGSGSAVYGLFNIGSEDAYSAYINLRNDYPDARTWVGTTFTS